MPGAKFTRLAGMNPQYDARPSGMESAFGALASGLQGYVGAQQYQDQLDEAEKQRQATLLANTLPAMIREGMVNPQEGGPFNIGGQGFGVSPAGTNVRETGGDMLARIRAEYLAQGKPTPNSQSEYLTERLAELDIDPIYAKLKTPEERARYRRDYMADAINSYRQALYSIPNINPADVDASADDLAKLAEAEGQLQPGEVLARTPEGKDVALASSQIAEAKKLGYTIYGKAKGKAKPQKPKYSSDPQGVLQTMGQAGRNLEAIFSNIAPLSEGSVAGDYWFGEQGKIPAWLRNMKQNVQTGYYGNRTR